MMARPPQSVRLFFLQKKCSRALVRDFRVVIERDLFREPPHPRHSSRSDHAGRAHRLCARWGRVLRREGHSADFAELAGEFRP